MIVGRLPTQNGVLDCGKEKDVLTTVLSIYKKGSVTHTRTSFQRMATFVH